MSGVLLLIFAFSIMPKIIVHNLVVSHKDTPVLSGKYAQVSQTGFHCDCENQVVELPYITHVISIQLTVQASFHTYQTRAHYQFYSFPHFIFGLRGPPFSV